MNSFWVVTAIVVLIAQADAANYCGSTYVDSKRCHRACPRGTNGECGPGETCYANVPCSSGGGASGTPANYCGRNYEDSKKCGTACPRGMNSECPAGETCFANIPCGGSEPSINPTTSPSSPSPSGFIVTEALFNQLFPARTSFYTYAGLAAAAAAYPKFTKTGSVDTQKREAAAFLANIAHESGFLKYIREINQNNWPGYCDSRVALANGFSATCVKNGKQFQYYGRGPIQLSWNFNYLAAGNDFGVNLIDNPDRVATDSTIAWKTAIWFWMRQRGAGSITPHDAMTNQRGFGETIRSINGALECNGRRPDIVTKRVGYYTQFVSVMDTSAGPGSLRC